MNPEIVQTIPFEFQEFPKLARLKRDCIITEKIDGTNAQIYLDENGMVLVGSRNRYLAVIDAGDNVVMRTKDDNYGFAGWVHRNITELRKLGPGRHFGEWWGSGIQRGYGQSEKIFSLFNVNRWQNQELPACVRLVPVLYRGEFSSLVTDEAITHLRLAGSKAAPGFPKPEGIVVYHTAAQVGFKRTLEHDDKPKSLVN